MANISSNRAISAALNEDEIDLNIQKLWYDLLPELGYRLNTDHEKNSYDYLGAGDPPSSVDYSFYGDPFTEVKDESITSKGTLDQELYFKQKLFSSQISNLIQAEKNKSLQKEIIKTQLKKYLLFEVRMNYFLAILYRNASEGIGEMKLIYEQEPDTTAQTKDVIATLKKRALIDLDATKLQLESSRRGYEISLLSLLHLPLDSTLELTSSMDAIAIESDSDSKKALENNIEIKYYLLNGKRMQSDLSASVLNYLPQIQATLKSELSDRIDVDLTAYFNGANNYSLDFGGSILLDERTLLSETYGNVTPTESDWDVNNDLDFSISLTYSLDSILKTNNGRALINNNISINENNIKEVIQYTLQQLAEYSASIDEKQKLVENSENMLEVAIELKRTIDESFIISSLSDVSFYNSLYSSLKSETNNLDFYRRQLIESFFRYQNIVEGQ